MSLSATMSLARTIDTKSEWTAGHSDRVSQIAVSIGRAMGRSEEELEQLHRGGLLHDIGKVGVPAHVIDKPGALDEEETQAMRRHVTIGARILEPLRALTDVLPIVLYHHEWFDGSGYPAGRSGTHIPLLARIMAVSDAFDALQADRPYRTGISAEESLGEITKASGTQFDPEPVGALDDLMRSGSSPLPIRSTSSTSDPWASLLLTNKP